MIFITSYPYVSLKHIRVFDFFKKKDDLVFILPEVWKMKGGKVVMKPIQKTDLCIIPTPAHFFHSKYFLIHGLLKGWMPATGKILKHMSKPGDILYTAIEPNLLTTFFNGRTARRLGLKHVFFTWQNIRWSKKSEFILRRVIARSDGAICGNIKAFEVLKPYLPTGYKTAVMPISGVDTEHFRPRSIPHNDIVITFVGALDHRKGIDTLLEAYAIARRQDTRLRLLIVGSGILEHTIPADVTHLPWMANEKLPKILNASDIFAYPSRPFGGWEEQFGYSAAEASSCGLPVITTECGSLPDIVINEKTGYVIQPNDSQTLAQKILFLAAHPEERKRMGEAGRRHIISTFSHQIVAEKMETFLRNV